LFHDVLFFSHARKEDLVATPETGTPKRLYTTPPAELQALHDRRQEDPTPFPERPPSRLGEIVKLSPARQFLHYIIPLLTTVHSSFETKAGQGFPDFRQNFPCGRGFPGSICWQLHFPEARGDE